MPTQAEKTYDPDWLDKETTRLIARTREMRFTGELPDATLFKELSEILYSNGYTRRKYQGCLQMANSTCKRRGAWLKEKDARIAELEGEVERLTQALADLAKLPDK